MAVNACAHADPERGVILAGGPGESAFCRTGFTSLLHEHGWSGEMSERRQNEPGREVGMSWRALVCGRTRLSWRRHQPLLDDPARGGEHGKEAAGREVIFGRNYLVVVPTRAVAFRSE